MNLRVRLLASLLLVLFAPPLFSQTAVDPAAILRDAALLGRFSSLEVRFALEISERRGVKERELLAYVEQDGEERRALVQVVSPAFLSNLKFLSLASGDERSQWMSTSRGVRRVAAGNRDERLFDSDFTVEDLSAYDPDDYDLSLLGTENVGEVECYVLQAIPNDTAAHGDRKLLYVSVEERLLYAAEFYAGGSIERRFELIDTMMVDGTPFPRVARMTTVDADTNTLLTVSSAQPGIDIPDRVFNRGNL